MGLIQSEADIVTSAGTYVIPSFTTVTGRLYICAVADTQAISEITGPGVFFTWHKLQTADTGDFIEFFAGVCSAGGTGTGLITVAAGTGVTYAIIEVGNNATAPIIKTASAGALTVTLTAATGVQSATFLMAKSTPATLGVETGYQMVANVGTTRKLVCGFNQVYDTTPSFTSSGSFPAIIGVEISSLSNTIAATNSTVKSRMRTGYGQ